MEFGNNERPLLHTTKAGWGGSTFLSFFFPGYVDRSSSCHCKRLFATFPIPHTFKGPLSRPQHEVQRPILPTPNPCWCISESSSSDVSSSSPFCFSVLTLHYKHIIYSLVLPRVGSGASHFRNHLLTEYRTGCTLPLKKSYILNRRPRPRESALCCFSCVLWVLQLQNAVTLPTYIES